MKVEDAIRANELVTALQDGLEMQRVILEGLRDNLQEYNDFLTMQIRDMQRELGTYDTEVEELWAVIDKSPTYRISNYGNVVRPARVGFITNQSGRFPAEYKSVELAKNKDSGGYYRVKLIDKYHSISRLVATHFIPNPNNLPEVNHKDGDKANNHYTNLEWVTRSENMKHAVRNGLTNNAQGEDHYKAKLSYGAVNHIRSSTDSSKDLADKYGVTPGLIVQVRANKIWKEQE